MQYNYCVLLSCLDFITKQDSIGKIPVWEYIKGI